MTSEQENKVVNFDFLQTVSMPLNNISVAVTGTKRFVNKMTSQLEKLGADVKIIDYLNVVEYRDNPKLDHALSCLEKYNWIVLTSINGAEFFFGRLSRLKTDIRTLSKIKFAVIGSGTVEILEKRGIYPDLIPESYTSSSLGNKLSEAVGKGERVLILRAEQGSKELSDILDDNNIDYDDIKTYDVICDKEKGCEIDTDFITFASSSGVNAFFESGFKISPKTGIICIGDITAKALKRRGTDDFRISKTSNIQGITEMILSEAEKCRDSEG